MNVRRLVAAAALGSLFACGAPSAPADAGQPETGGGDAGAHDGGLTDAGTGDAGGAGAWGLRWTRALDFPFSVDHHGTFVAEFDGGVGLYVVGGALTGTNKAGSPTGGHTHADGPVYDGVFAARIQPDGLLAPWGSDGGEALGSGLFTRVHRFFPLAFHGLAAEGRDAVATAGVVATEEALNAPTSPSLLAVHLRVEDDGSVRTVGTVLLEEAAMHPTASLVGGRVVVIGGTDFTGQLSASVWAAPLDALAPLPDGGVARPFVAQQSLPQPRSHHAALVHDGHIYLVGGYSWNQAPLSDIWRSVHAVDGRIIGWDVVGTLDDPSFTSSVFEFDGELYVVGGGTFAGGGAFINRVRRAPFFPTGDLGFFTDVADALPQRRGHVHQTPVRNGHVYSLGGRDLDAAGNIVSLNRVDVGHFERR